MAPRRKGTRAPRGDRIEPHFGRPRPKARGQRKPKTRRRRTAGSRRRPILRTALRLLLLASLAAFLAVGGAVLLLLSRLPDPALLALDGRPPNLTILAADGTVLSERGLRRGHVRIDRMSPHFVKAVIATEDRRFWSHSGLDLLGLLRASLRNLQAGAVVEGGSTITQQLAKNLFLKPDRTVARKLEEAIYALWLEQNFSKEEILELYLNRVYFGAGTYGVEAAARRYFGHGADQLDLSQAALLAGLLKAPSRYAPTRSAELAATRLDVVLDSMADAGFISEAEANAASSEPLQLRAFGDETGYAYAVDWTTEILPRLVGEGEGDLIVHTTIDASLQRMAQQALRQRLESEGKSRNASQGAVVVLDPSGGVKALIGGRSYSTSPFDRAVKALRQPGSAFKPFVYLAALEHGYRPDSIVVDAPVAIGRWSPRNHDGDYHGAMSLKASFAQSVNTVAAKLVAEGGVSPVLGAARRLGIGAELHDQPSLALGTAEVTLLELTAAYAPFANGGRRALPYIVTSVRNGDGQVLYARDPAAPLPQVVAPAQIGAMNEMMQATVESGTGRQAALPGHAAGGKTGTTQNFRDAWFVGYTAHYVAGVWIGNDDGAKMRHVVGGTLPAKVWRDLMLAAHGDRPSLPLPGTEGSWLGEAVSHLPWNRTPDGRTDAPFYRRVLGILAGGSD